MIVIVLLLMVISDDLDNVDQCDIIRKAGFDPVFIILALRPSSEIYW